MEFADIVWAAHVGFIVWMVWAPFSGMRDMVLLHAAICPFLMAHWIMHSDGCALTVLEKQLRGLENDSESFIHRLVAPVYVIDDAVLKRVVFIATLGLWSVSLYRILHDYWYVKKKRACGTMSTDSSRSRVDATSRRVDA